MSRADLLTSADSTLLRCEILDLLASRPMSTDALRDALRRLGRPEDSLDGDRLSRRMGGHAQGWGRGSPAPGPDDGDPVAGLAPSGVEVRQVNRNNKQKEINGLRKI